MESKCGRAWFVGNKLQFDEVGWAMIKRVAARKKMSPTKVVVAALKRAAKAGAFNAKA